MLQKVLLTVALVGEHCLPWHNSRELRRSVPLAHHQFVSLQVCE